VKTEIDKGYWYKQLIYFPKDIKDKELLPLVIISHGNGHNYKQYKYLQEHLASKGFIVVSHTNRTGPGIESASTTTLENTDVFFDNISEIDNGTLQGNVDRNKIAWIGHSRGGEGVVRAYTKLRNNKFTPKHYNANSIKLISSISPTTHLSSKKSDPLDVNYHMFYGGADGDVRGNPRSGSMPLALYENGKGEKQLTYVQGAGHNVFNDSSSDEGQGPDRLKREDVHLISKITYEYLLNCYLLGDQVSKKYFVSNWSYLRPKGIPIKIPISNDYKPALKDLNIKVLDNFQEDQVQKESQFTFDVDNLKKGHFKDSDGSLKFTAKDHFNGMTRFYRKEKINKSSSQGVGFDWNKDSYLKYTFIETIDLTYFSALSFRAAQGTQHPLTIELDSSVTFSIEIKDENGLSQIVSIEPFGEVLTPYKRSGGWANEFNIVRIPLNEIKVLNLDIDFTRIKEITFLFGPDYGSPFGRLFFDDLLLIK